MFSALRFGVRGARLAWKSPHPNLKPPPCALRGVASFPAEELDLTERAFDLSASQPSTTVAETLTSAGEPTLASLGLGGWSPPGMVQSFLEYVHVTADVPWWGAIAFGTVCVRILLFPLIIKARRDAVNMHNNMPGLTHLQKKFGEARASGDRVETEKYAVELIEFMRTKKANPFKNMIAPMAQMPFFVSFFVGLRQMASLPVESMKSGGMLWFEDLTVVDPLLGLPLITSLTLFVTIEIGAEAGTAPNKVIKNVLRLVPFAMLPVTTQFPAAILCYWTCTNFLTLIQAAFLRVPAVREHFNIPKMIEHPKQDREKQMASFKEELMKSFNNVSMSKKVQERRDFLDKLQQKQGK